MKTIRIPVVTRTQDNGDGGYTTYAYNSEDELIADHPKSSEWKKVNGEYKEVAVELSPEQRKKILNEDDPYENGYIGHGEVVVEVDDNGTARLAKPISLHGGQ